MFKGIWLAIAYSETHDEYWITHYSDWDVIAFKTVIHMKDVLLSIGGLEEHVIFEVLEDGTRFLSIHHPNQ
tara:strand:+ start:32 stop:244 length:213 start_codon:yes stop_codon:yes gene_type:complete